MLREKIIYQTAVQGTAIFLIPFLVGRIFQIPWLMLQNFTDGAFYLGYGLSFRQLLEFAGLYYYATRFPAILPDALLIELFGGPVGFVVWNYLLSGLCCVAVWDLFRKRGSSLVGWIAALTWASNPFAIRFLQTAYSDVEGASFLFLSLCVALRPELSWRGAILSGILAALAFWSHSHAAVALAFCSFLVLPVWLKEGWKNMLFKVCSGIAGFLLVTAAASMWYYSVFGMWDLSSPTREVLRLLREGIVEKPVLDWRSVTSQNTFWFAVLPLGVAIFLIAPRSKLAVGAWLALLAFTLYLLLDDLAGGGYSLSLFYYYSFAVPATVLAFAYVFEGILMGGKKSPSNGLVPPPTDYKKSADFSNEKSGAKDVSQKTEALPFHNTNWKKILLLTAVIIVPVLISGKLNLGVISGIALGAIVVFIIGFLLIKTNWRMIFGGAFLACAGGLVAAAPASRIALGGYWKTDDFPLLQTAYQISSYLKKETNLGEGVRFYYTDDGQGDGRMVQSFFLHEFSKWRNNNGKVWTFPTDANIPADQTLRDGIQNLILLSKSSFQIEDAIRFLKNRGLKIEKTHVPENLPDSVCWTHIRFTVPEANQNFDSQEVHHDFEAIGRGKISKTKCGTLIQTPPRRWSKAAYLETTKDGEKTLRVDCRVITGMVLLEAVSAPNDAGAPYPRIVLPSVFTKQFYLPVSPSAPFLRIRNYAPDGASSAIEIKGVFLGNQKAADAFLK